MSQFSLQASSPWYRELWPWLLMLGPALVIVAGCYTAWLAVSTADGLVADDYYKQGLNINRRLARDESAARLGLDATVRARGGIVAVSLRRASAAQGDWPATLSLQFLHPTRSGFDQSIALARRADGEYEGKLPAPARGMWNLAIEHRDWRLTGKWAAPFIDSAHLRPGE